jgi:hypothetical protein
MGAWTGNPMWRWYGDHAGDERPSQRSVAKEITEIDGLRTSK